MQTKIYGHRGSKGTSPENTLQSFNEALEAGVAGLELDIHLTKDGEIVVIHDETLDRTTKGKGAVIDLTLAKIKEMDDSVPTLQEVLDLLAGTDVELNIELKTSLTAYEGIEAKVLELMKNETRKVVYSSFNLPSIMRIKQLDPQADIAWLLWQTIPQPAEHMKELNLESLHLGKDLLLEHPEHWKGLYDKIRVWTVNDENEVAKLKKLGVEAIITDYPYEVING